MSFAVTHDLELDARVHACAERARVREAVACSSSEIGTLVRAGFHHDEGSRGSSLLLPYDVFTVYSVKTRTPSRTRTVAYLRVSTARQADHGVSLDVQRAKVTAYAELFDLDLVAVEVDAGESAKSLDRPALQRALSMLKNGSADALLGP